MKCVFCGGSTKVVDVRAAGHKNINAIVASIADNDNYLARRRECLSCNRRFATLEVTIADAAEIFGIDLNTVKGGAAVRVERRADAVSMRSSGRNLSEIAAKYGVTTETVRNWLKRAKNE